MNISIREYAKKNKVPSHYIMRKLKENGYKPRNIMQELDLNTLDKLFNEGKQDFLKQDLKDFKQLDKALMEESKYQ